MRTHRLFQALVIGGSGLIVGCAGAESDRGPSAPSDAGGYGKADGAPAPEAEPVCTDGSSSGGHEDPDLDTESSGSSGTDGEAGDACVCAGEGWQCSGNGVPCCWAVDPCCEPCCPHL